MIVQRGVGGGGEKRKTKAGIRDNDTYLHKLMNVWRHQLGRRISHQRLKILHRDCVMSLLHRSPYAFPKRGNRDLAYGFGLRTTIRRDDQLQRRSRRGKTTVLRLSYRRSHHNLLLRWFILPLMFPRQKATSQTGLGFLFLSFNEFCFAKPGRHS